MPRLGKLTNLSKRLFGGRPLRIDRLGLPVDILKIDRDLIRNLGESAGRPVIDAIITLSKTLRLTTVAEGIEDLGQAAEASNAGIDIGQGYLFSRPLTVDDFTPAAHECVPAVASLGPPRTPTWSRRSTTGAPRWPPLTGWTWPSCPPTP